ncbi:MAG: tRNA(Ile)(2)-agmatinylcytidine synthase [Candidatus Bathyarchaeota archaeon]|nr:tRNA(Ile)(2)-agmatinylcytidine synthase [Candidatus Bathyarchaeota archaeon]
MSALKLHIGLDDTDSPEGGCTTYLAARLIEPLMDMGAKFIGYPTLLRLNPNTPWKTRGNAGMCLRMEIDDSKYDAVREKVRKLIEEYGEFQCDNTNPGAVFLQGDVPEEVKEYALRVVRSIVDKKDALALLNKYNIDFIEYKNGRGIIGALAAIGGTPEEDFTYELLTYRVPENWGTERQVDQDSIIEMDKALQDCTFNNVDEKGKPLITPRGPDPVLYGVRGENPKAVYDAMCMIKPLEPIERWMICRTNQGTDQHFSEPIKINELVAYNPAIVEGTVDSVPETIEGGHVFFKLKDETGVVTCAAYEPTGSFREIIRQLRPGDKVTTYSGVSLHENEYTLNLEKLEINDTAPEYQLVKPKCPKCGGSTESMGRDQGLRCKKCGYRGVELVEEEVPIERRLSPGIYLPDKGAHRHLTKPYERYGREKTLLVEV